MKIRIATEQALAYEIVVLEFKDVGELTSTTLVKERLELRQYFKVLIESIQYLARQGLVLRRDNDDNDNLTQLLRLRGKDGPEILERLESKTK